MRLFISALACFLSLSVFSQTTFTGTINNVWAEAGNWDNGLPAAGNDATIPDGLTVINGDFLPINFTIDNFGTIDNLGGLIYNDGTINNGGTINNDGFIDNGGVIDNNGSIINDGDIINNNYGTIDNFGTIVNDNFGTIVNDNFGTINNGGTINNDGNIENGGAIDNFETIVNNGTIENGGTIDQCGIWEGDEPVFNPYTPCAGSGCTDTSACNYDAAATSDDGSCESLSCADCCGVVNGDGTTCDGDCGPCGEGIPDGDCDCNGNQLDECGVCGGDNSTCSGCTYADATNYDSTATIDDGSCVFPDITSDNQEAYDEGAASVDITSDNQEAYDEGAASVCPGDFSGDGNVNVSDLGGFLGAFGNQCSTTSLLGCTDSTAFNYDSNANTDDDSCIAVVNGCTDASATNYNVLANTDDESCIVLVIGDPYQGGIIFYLNGSGGGLIAAPSDQSAGAAWGCYGNSIPVGAAIGTGAQNTIDIDAGCSTPGIAADICANLTLGGFNDWFLPSKDELNELYLNVGQGNALGLGNVGGFANDYYWSSTKYNNLNAWIQNFANGNQVSNNVSDFVNAVRAVRAF